MSDWIPTHQIYRNDTGEQIEVMLSEQSAYTLDDWTTYDSPDYTVDDSGGWLFQGQAFSGVVYLCKGGA